MTHARIGATTIILEHRSKPALLPSCTHRMTVVNGALIRLIGIATDRRHRALFSRNPLHAIVDIVIVTTAIHSAAQFTRAVGCPTTVTTKHRMWFVEFAGRWSSKNHRYVPGFAVGISSSVITRCWTGEPTRSATPPIIPIAHRINRFVLHVQGQRIDAIVGSLGNAITICIEKSSISQF